ncbi:MAG: ATP-binding protein, partial [Cyanobacteriota bacterium]
MPLDLASFHHACSPSGTLLGENKDDQYYIDLSSVRGSQLVSDFKEAITTASDEPTCQMLAAHLGCWKSQELQRLKAELESEGWHVTYCQATQDVDLADVEILDILLMLARQVSASVEPLGIKLKSRYFSILFKAIALILQFPVEGSPEANLSIEISKLTNALKNNPQFRFQLRVYLECRTQEILKAINEELLGTAIKELKHRGYKGLVMIVDELEGVTNRRLALVRMQPESLFIDQAAYLHHLNCHMVYTLPVALMFSQEYAALNHHLGGEVASNILPMVPMRQRDGSDCEEGIALLRQVVLVRAFPHVEPEQRLHLISEVFDRPETLDRLCRVSGGYVRYLLALLYKCFWEEEPPFS